MQPRAPDLVPARKRRDVRLPGAREAVDHEAPRQRREVDRVAAGRRERQARQPHPGQMVAGAVVGRRRQVRGQGMKIAGHSGSTILFVVAAPPSIAGAMTARPGSTRRAKTGWLTLVPPPRFQPKARRSRALSSDPRPLVPVRGTAAAAARYATMRYPDPPALARAAPPAPGARGAERIAAQGS